MKDSSTGEEGRGRKGPPEGLRVRRVNDESYRALGEQLGANSSKVFLSPVRRAPSIGAPQHTPFGMLAPSLMELFGVQSDLFEAFARELRPRCSGCDQVLERPASIDAMPLPTEGFLAAVLADDRTDIPARERCELLGAERVFADGRIVRIEEAQGGNGEPVLVLMSASHVAEFRREAQGWLERGSDQLRILHLADRAAQPTEIGDAFANCRCDGCGCSVPIPAKLDFAACNPCVRCKGEGWLEVESARLIACEECGGFGSAAAPSRYDWRGIEWRHVAALPFGRVRAAFSDEISALAAVCECGFGDYPIGAPAGIMSEGERARATLLNTRLSGLRQVSFVADGAALWSEPPEQGEPALEAFFPDVFSSLRTLKRASGQVGRFVVRDIQQGPLEADEVGGEVGAALAIQGVRDLEGHYVLEEIARTFAKRRKLSHRCSFGPLKSCLYVNPLAPLPSLIGDVLGISRLISEDFARTRAARERGLEARDFSLASSRYRCVSCAAGLSQGPECAECGGWLVDPSVGSVAFGGLAFGEAMHTPLADIRQMLWRSDAVAAALGAVPEQSLRALTLASRSEALPPEELRALYLRAQLAGAAAVLGREASASLVLVHAPCCVAAAHQRAVWDAMGDLNDRGATIVCADIPAALESCFGSVVRLRAQPGGAASRMASPLYDVRLARPLTIEVVKT